MHCPKYGRLQQAMGRAYTDIDFAAYSQHTTAVRTLFEKLGYEDNKEVFIVSGGERAIFDRADMGLHVDIFYEKLDFCHVIRWNGRLEVDKPSIPLAELLLEKMQIVQINEKDVIDTIMLLLEHELGDIDKETINIGRGAAVAPTTMWTTMNPDRCAWLTATNSRLKNPTCRQSRRRAETHRAEPKPWPASSGRVGDASSGTGRR
jgi:hypothetical protein